MSTTDKDEAVKPEAITIVEKGTGRFQAISRLPKPSSTQVMAHSDIDEQFAQALLERRAKFVEEDSLVKTILAGGDAISVLCEIKREIAREAANLHFDRVELDRKAKDGSSASLRRIEALRRIADIELKIRELDQHSVNLSSEKMQKVFGLWVEVMREVAQDVLPAEQLDLFFNRFATAMDNWEERAQDVLR